MYIELVFIMDAPAGYELLNLTAGQPAVVPSIGDAVWVRGQGWLIESKLLHYDTDRISIQMQVTRPRPALELLEVARLRNSENLVRAPVE